MRLLVMLVLCGGPAAAVPALSAAQPLTTGSPTFNREVAPILAHHCGECHRPGGIGPFSVLSYGDVRSRAARIADAVRTRAMPPWKPEPGYGEFEGARRMADAEIASIVRWADAGAVEGDSALTSPVVPEFPGGWALGPPDLVLTMPEAFELPAGGMDVFRLFVLPVPLAEGRYVRAVEFQPGNPRVVHHVTMRLDRSGQSRRLDDQSPGPGSGALTPFSASGPDGQLLGWTPGQRPYRSGEGMPWRLEAGTDFVLEMHLRPAERVETIRSKVGLYFTTGPSVRTPVALRLGRQDIDIPPGASRHGLTDRFTLPVDVEVHGVYPHAHNLARDVRASALLPNGSTEPLLYIRDWDFNWQDLYRYVTPRVLPAGTVLTVTFTFDNSGGNPRNPGRPPRRVLYGKNSSDEMGDLWLQLVARREADAGTLKLDVLRKMLAADIAGIQTMLRASPDDRALHDQAALLFEAAGDRERALRAFSESLRLQPDAAAFNNIGYMRLKLGQLADARAALLRAVALSPEHARAHHNLGLVSAQEDRHAEAAEHFRQALQHDAGDAASRQSLGFSLQALGRTDEAIEQYREVVRAAEAHPDAHYLLASALSAHQQGAEAVLHYRRALELRPDWPLPMVGLALLLAADPDPAIRRPGEALALATRAARLTPSPLPAAVAARAAALAALGDFDQALSVARSALAAAEDGGQAELADEIRRHMERYRLRRPIFEP